MENIKQKAELVREISYTCSKLLSLCSDEEYKEIKILKSMKDILPRLLEKWETALIKKQETHSGS
jgi:hypothetical protein